MPRLTAGNFSGSMSLQDMEERAKEIRKIKGLGSVEEAALASEVNRVKDAAGKAEMLKGDVANPMGGVSMDKAAAGAAIAQQAGIIPSGGAVGGAASGAMLGAKFGPYGALIGGAVGGIAGAAKAKRARKQAKAEAEAGHQLKLAEIEGEKQMRIQAAMQSMAGNIGATLRSVG